MTAESNSHDADGRTIRKGPESVASITKVNVAFPFSQVKIAEPSEHLVALADVVDELARLVADSVPGPEAKDLRRRAHELVGQLR
ncbi:MAG TPA: hypothetical protein VN840_17780 [Streptosporangiaceae bacterium]|nr:hypothetical protein [Streptosporangiaceae bacterium]